MSSPVQAVLGAFFGGIVGTAAGVWVCYSFIEIPGVQSSSGGLAGLVRSITFCCLLVAWGLTTVTFAIAGAALGAALGASQGSGISSRAKKVDLDLQRFVRERYDELVREKEQLEKELLEAALKSADISENPRG